MCSAMGQKPFVYEAIKLGAKDFILKPFGKERLFKAIEKLLVKD